MTDDDYYADRAKIRSLSDLDKERIITDLIVCLRTGRLVDFSIGYEVTTKGNFKPNKYTWDYGVRPTAGPPQWASLAAAGWTTTDWGPLLSDLTVVN